MSLPSPVRRSVPPIGWRVATWLVLVLVLLFAGLTLTYGLVLVVAGDVASRLLAVLAAAGIVGVLLALLIWHGANRRLVRRFGVGEHDVRHPALAYLIFTTLLAVMLQFILGTDHPVARLIQWLLRLAAAGFLGWAVLSIRARVLRLFASTGASARLGAGRAEG
jgi:hypothetical protein